MSASSDLITHLREYCAKKTGSVGLITFGEQNPSYHILGGFLDSFASFRLDETPITLMLRCSLELLNQLMENRKQIHRIMSITYH